MRRNIGAEIREAVRRIKEIRVMTVILNGVRFRIRAVFGEYLCDHSTLY